MISRSGDECVAAFLDQWFLTYGVDEAWREQTTLAHLRGDDGLGFNCLGTVTKHSLEQTFWVDAGVVRRHAPVRARDGAAVGSVADGGGVVGFDYLHGVLYSGTTMLGGRWRRG